MLGILYWIFAGGAMLVGKHIDTNNDIAARRNAIEFQKKGMNRAGTYIDHNGRTKDIKTGEARVVWPDEHDEVWVRDVYGKKLRNLTQEKKIEAWQEKVAKCPERKAVYYDIWSRRSSKVRGKSPFDVVVGRVYKDTQTGELYLPRRISWNPTTNNKPKSTNFSNEPGVYASFYMRVTDGTLVSLKDDWQEDCKGENCANSEQIDAFMKYFNQKQREGGWIKDNIIVWREDGITTQEFYLNTQGYDRVY